MSIDSEELSDNLAEWTVLSVSAEELTIKMNFSVPIKVSQGDEKDEILIFMNFSDFEDNDGLSLPQFVFLKMALPY